MKSITASSFAIFAFLAVVLVIEGKITCAPCDFGYSNTPNMAMMQQEKWTAESLDTDIASYRLSLLRKYAIILVGHLQGVAEVDRRQFRRLFLERAILSRKGEARFLGVASGLGNDVNVDVHKQKESR